LGDLGGPPSRKRAPHRGAALIHKLKSKKGTDARRNRHYSALSAYSAPDGEHDNIAERKYDTDKHRGANDYEVSLLVISIFLKRV
jgi:hypothetical protein